MEPARLTMSAFWAMCQVTVCAVLVWVNWRAASGRLPRNPKTGLRTAATMSSDTAWVAGHRAALRFTPFYVLVLAATLAALVAVVLRSDTMGLAMVVGCGGLIAFVPVAIYSTIVANRAAKSAGRSPNDRPQL